MVQMNRQNSGYVGGPVFAIVAIYVWLVANPQIGWLNSAILLADLAVVSLPFAIILLRMTGRLGFAECAASMGAGLAALGVIGMILTNRGLPDITAELPFLLVSGIVLTIWHKRPLDIPGSATAAVGWRLGAVTALTLPLSYVLFCAWIGGRGAFPSFMLSADLSSDLALIRSLLASHQMPPVLLPFADETMGYHYGATEATAHLVRLTGIPPHVALLYVFLPAVWSSAAASAWLIARRLTRRGCTLLAAASVLAVCLFMSHDMLEGETKTAKMIFLWLTGHALDQKPFIKLGVTHASIAAGISLSWFSFMLLAHWQSRAARWLVAFVVGLMAVVDAFFFASIGLVLGLWSLRQAWRDRNPWILAVPASALALALILQRVTGSTDSGYSISLAFFGNDYVNRFALGTLRHGAALIAIIAFACLLPRIARGDAHRPRQMALGIILIGVLLFCIANFTVMRYGGQEDTNFNWYRWLFIVPALLGLAAAASMDTIIDQRARWPRYVLALLLLLAVPLQLLRYPVTGIQTLAAPTLRGDETLDTGSLTEALSHIPVAGSLIVVSDLRYPSTNAPDNDPLVSAIYGHRCYLCVVWPNQNWTTEMAQRSADIKLLQAESWAPQLTELAKQRRWTHLLIRKAGPHARDIPLTLVFENQDYAVYQF